MQRTKIDEYISGVKAYAQDTIRHYINGIGDNAGYVAEVLVSDMFADMPTVNNAYGLYAAFEEIEGQADYFCDNYVSPQDWAGKLSESELFEQLERSRHDSDEYVELAGVEKDAGDTFTDYVLRVVRWWYQDAITSGCTIAVQAIRDRLQDLMLELEEDYGDDDGTIPDKAL